MARLNKIALVAVVFAATVYFYRKPVPSVHPVSSKLVTEANASAVTLPAARPPSTLPAAPATAARADEPTWEDFSVGADQLGRTDKAGLAALENAARQKLLQPGFEGRLYHEIESTRPAFAAADFHQSFFTIRVLARYGQHPDGLLTALLAPSATPENPTRADHMKPLLEADRLQRLRSLALNELRQRYENDPSLAKSPGEMMKLVGPSAKHDPSLDVAIEATRLLGTVYPPETVRKVIASRSPRDVGILSQFLPKR